MMAEPERLTRKIKYKTNQGQRFSAGIQSDGIQSQPHAFPQEFHKND